MSKFGFISCKKRLKSSLAVSAIVGGLFVGGHSAHATTIDGTACRPNLPLNFYFFAFDPGGIEYGDGLAYVTSAGSGGTHAFLTCNIPNSSNLGSTIRFRIGVRDGSVDHPIGCRGVVSDLTGSEVAATPWATTSVGSTGGSTLTVQVGAPSSTQTPFYLYRVECEVPGPQLGGGSFPSLSGIGGIILD